MKKKEKIVYQYKDMKLDSQGELEFCYYLEELQERGFVKEFKRGTSLILSNSVKNDYIEILKTKLKKKSETIILPHTYEFDFVINWNKKAEKVFFNERGQKWVCPFFCETGLFGSFIECKPGFDFANMGRLAVINTKWIYETYKIFVQIIKNEELFTETFVPKKCLKTKTGKPRTFKFEVRSLEEYLKLKEK